MIYIDPPYNTGRTFLYPDNFRATGTRGARTPAESGARTHARWLSMMYPRLIANEAKKLFLSPVASNAETKANPSFIIVGCTTSIVINVINKNNAIQIVPGSSI
jgi:hypothetical protein